MWDVKILFLLFDKSIGFDDYKKISKNIISFTMHQDIMPKKLFDKFFKCLQMENDFFWYFVIP